MLRPQLALTSRPSRLIGRASERAALAEAVARASGDLTYRGAAVLVGGEAWVGKSALLESLAEVSGGGPRIVLLDDLHALDADRLATLPAFADELAVDGAVLVGAYRSEEVGAFHPLRAIRAQLRRTHRLLEVAVPRMPDADVSTLVARIAPAATAAQVTAVVLRAEGVPLFAEHLAATLAAAGEPALDDVPEALHDAVALRTLGLGTDARSLLVAASVLGATFDPDLARDVAGGLDEATLDLLTERGLVLPGEDGSSVFRHRLVRDAVLAGLSPARRRHLHRTAAHALSAAGAPARVVAGHAVAARDQDLARTATLAAAEDLVGGHAYREAIGLLHTALAWSPPTTRPRDGDRGRIHERMHLIERLAYCLEQVGELAQALPLLRELVDVHARLDDPLGQATTLQRTARAGEILEDWPLALVARQDAARLYAAAGHHQAAGLERLAAAAHLRSAGCYSAALPELAAAREDAVRAGDAGLLARVDALHGNVLTRSGQVQGVAQVTAALHTALAQGLTSAAAEVQQRLGDCLEHTGDYAGAQLAYAAAVEFCDLHGHDATQALCRACAGYVLFQRGDWDAAAVVERTVLRSEPGGHSRAAAASVLGLVLALRGQATTARPHLLDGAITARRADVLAPQILAAWGLAAIECATRPADRALAACHALLGLVDGGEECHYSVPSLQWAVTALADGGHLPEARRATARLAAIAQASPHAETLAAWTHAQAEVAVIDADPEAALVLYRRALTHQSTTGVAYPSALLATRAARTLREAGLGEEAVALCRSARRIAHRLRAAPLLRALDGELAALGERPDVRRRPDARHPVVPELTDREAEVLALVAEGHTSRQIASRLFLSPRTVDMHVRNVMVKLDCRTRAQAVTRFTELTAPPTRSA